MPKPRSDDEIAYDIESFFSFVRKRIENVEKLGSIPADTAGVTDASFLFEQHIVLAAILESLAGVWAETLAPELYKHNDALRMGECLLRYGGHDSYSRCGTQAMLRQADDDFDETKKKVDESLAKAQERTATKRAEALVKFASGPGSEKKRASALKHIEKQHDDHVATKAKIVQDADVRRRAIQEAVRGPHYGGLVYDWKSDPTVEALCARDDLKDLGLSRSWFLHSRYGEMLYRDYRCGLLHEMQQSGNLAPDYVHPERVEPWYMNYGSANRSTKKRHRQRRLSFPPPFLIQTLRNVVDGFEQDCISAKRAPAVMMRDDDDDDRDEKI